MSTERGGQLQIGEEDVYLEQLESLRGEMNAAMLAISGNSLRSLEESLWRQEVLCVSLKRLLQSMQGTRMESTALTRMRSAATALHAVNQTYAGLVQQSRASADLLSNLCRSYKEPSSGQLSSTNAKSCSFEA